MAAWYGLDSTDAKWEAARVVGRGVAQMGLALICGGNAAAESVFAAYGG